MAASLLKYANREAVAQALTERGYTVSRATVNRWAGGKEMPDIADRMIAELFGHSDTTKEAPPWAGPLVAEVGSILQVVESNADELMALKEALGAIQSELQQSGDDPPDDPAPVQSVGKRGR